MSLSTTPLRQLRSKVKNLQNASQALKEELRILKNKLEQSEAQRDAQAVEKIRKDIQGL